MRNQKDTQRVCRQKIGYIYSNDLVDDLAFTPEIMDYLLKRNDLSRAVRLIPILISVSDTMGTISDKLQKTGLRVFITNVGSQSLSLLWESYFRFFPDKILVDNYATSPESGKLRILKVLPDDVWLYKFVALYLLESGFQKIYTCYDPNDIFARDFARGMQIELSLNGIQNIVATDPSDIPAASTPHTGYLILYPRLERFDGLFENLLASTDATNGLFLSDWTQPNGFTPLSKEYIQKTPLSKIFKNYLPSTVLQSEISRLFYPVSGYINFTQWMIVIAAYISQFQLSSDFVFSTDFLCGLNIDDTYSNSIAQYAAYDIDFTSTLLFLPKIYFEHVITQNIEGFFVDIK